MFHCFYQWFSAIIQWHGSGGTMLTFLRGCWCEQYNMKVLVATFGYPNQFALFRRFACLIWAHYFPIHILRTDIAQMTIPNTSTVSHAFAVRDRAGSLHGETCVMDFLRCLMGEFAAYFDSPTQWRRVRLVSIYFLMRCSYICSCPCLTCKCAFVYVWHIGIPSDTIVVHDDDSSDWVWLCSLLPLSAWNKFEFLNPYAHVNRFGSLARIWFEGLTVDVADSAAYHDVVDYHMLRLYLFILRALQLLYYDHIMIMLYSLIFINALTVEVLLF